jgi:hypothetical protein
MPNFKSKFEAAVAKELDLEEAYEQVKFIYTVPETKHKYTPDFSITEKLCIETKGRLTSEDRYKMYCVRESNPTVMFVLYFQNSKVPIRKGSHTNCGMWAEKNGFVWYCKRTKPLTKAELQKLIKRSKNYVGHTSYRNV